MKLLDRNATAQLVEKMQALSGEQQGWRCIHLNLSGKAERYNRTLRAHFIVDAIRSLLAEVEGYVYLCDDGDIFILFEGALRPVAGKLGSHFEDLNAALREERRADNMFSVLDFSHPYDWQDFARLCRDKQAVAANGYRGVSGLAASLA